jgi:tetratricopeptide (TPR) repeat protein
VRALPAAPRVGARSWFLSCLIVSKQSRQECAPVQTCCRKSLRLQVSRVKAATILLILLMSPYSIAAAAAEKHTQSPSVVDSRLAEAHRLLDEKRVAEAEVAVRKHLAANPESAEGHFLLGLILFREVQSGAAPGDLYNAPGTAQANYREERAKASLAEFTAGARFVRPGAFDLKIVALNYVLLGDYSDADKWLTRSLEMNPGDAEGWYYLGRAKYNLNRFEEAVRAFQRSLKLAPKNVRAQDNLGLSYAGLNRTDDAVAAFQTAIQWQINDPKKEAGPFINLGSLLLDQDRPQEALPMLRQAAEAAPEQSKSHELLGKAYSQLNLLDDARLEFERAVQLAPGAAHLHYQLGQIYRRQGQFAKAQREFDRMSQLKENSAAKH